MFCAGLANVNAQAPAGPSVKIALAQRAWRPDGLLCYRSDEREGTKLHLIKITGEEVQPLFVKLIGGTAHPPFFCGDWIVTIRLDGTISKFDVSGKEVFAGKPSGLAGLVRQCGAVGARCVWVIETVADDKKRRISYCLCVVSVDGPSPKVEKRFKLRESGTVQVDAGNGRIWVFGQKKCHKFDIPRSCLAENG